MKPFKYTVLLLGALMLTASCLKDIPNFAMVSVDVTPPIEKPFINMTQVSVLVQSLTDPLSYKAFLSEDGSATLKVRPGRYSLLLSAAFEEGFSVSARSDAFLALESRPLDFSLQLDVALSGGIIFRQIYYAGSKTPEGANYNKDQFLELYNNSDQVYFLDSLCVGALAPANSTISSNPWAGKDTLGLFQMTWMIPGSGTDYPLAPGESAVLALNAVDHTLRCSSALDLSKASFAFYDELLSGHEKHPDVVPLKRIFAGQGSAYGLSVHSPAPVIFRPIMGVSKWLEDVASWQHYQPGSTGGLIYLHLHRSWILDGVECVQSPSSAIKRQPSAVDASYTYLQMGQNLGNAVVRKVSQVRPDGRIIYMDTNNSAEDFQTDVPAVLPSKLLRQ